MADRYFIYYEPISGKEILTPELEGIKHDKVLHFISIPVKSELSFQSLSTNSFTTKDPNAGLLVREFSKLNPESKIYQSEVKTNIPIGEEIENIYDETKKVLNKIVNISLFGLAGYILIKLLNEKKK